MIQFSCLRFIPSFTLNMSDILSSMYYGIGLIATVLESGTLRLPTLWRRCLFYGLLSLSIIKFSHLSHLSYGGKLWYRSECENSGLDIDCIRFPPHPSELADFIENSGMTTDSTQLTIYIGLAGMSQAFRYNQGQELEADKHIAILKQASFNQEAQIAKGSLRFHRVLPTPGITPDEAAIWARDVTQKGLERITAQVLQDANTALEAEKKKKAEQVKEVKLVEQQ